MYKLDDTQRAIINSDEPNIVTIAGAGSGKTTVLTQRVKRILQNTEHPESVIVITFTNNATERLKECLQDVPNSDKCFIGTIHSLASKLLRYIDNTFDIFTEDLQNEYMEYLINTYAEYSTYEDYTRLQKNIKEYNLGRTTLDPKYSVPSSVYEEIQTLLGNGKSYYNIFLSNYPETIRTLCKINNKISFDELLERCTEYYKATGVNVDYLFVDEFQDVGYLEYQFLISLNAKHTFFVGDDYQGIYGFKGGDVSILLSLIENPKYTKYYMINNYRNAKSILNFANMVINQVKDRVKKGSVAHNTNFGNVLIQPKISFDNWLQSFKDMSNLNKYFILTRSNNELEEVRGKLEKLSIPYVTFKSSELTLQQQRQALSTNTIKLLTVHASKGLECENVIIYGKFPLKVTPKTSSEEVKVFYVGITRAINNLRIFTGGR